MGGSAKGSHKIIMPNTRVCGPCVGCAPPRSTQNYGGSYYWQGGRV